MNNHLPKGANKMDKKVIVGVSIGIVSDITGASGQMLRRYEEKGLLPTPPRRNGWRMYDAQALREVVQFFNKKGGVN